jgi:hypothetical protein
MKTIGIHARDALSPGLAATFDALARVFGVAFERRAFEDDQHLAAWVVLGADRQSVLEVARATQPCYVVVDAAELAPGGSSGVVAFAHHVHLPAVLRGREIFTADATGAAVLPPWLTCSPAATKDGSAIWAVHDGNGPKHQYVSMAPPELKDEESLFDHFNGQRLVRLLPLVLFVRSLTDEAQWRQPPLQATFMFDDPNLHWTSYGFIDYQEMVSHATAGDYHVAVATIPLDGWFVHERTSAIFKGNRTRLSLLFHGNDHLSRELARYDTPEATRRMLRQAVGRVASMERRAGLGVARVMAPPHGACSQTTLSEMAALGFDAVCVSRGSLRRHNRGAPWTRTIGFRPCDVIGGLPVIPRFGLSTNCRNDILIAALLHQPIVPMTHHQAVADGYDLLDQTAAFVNSLGDVAWRDMETISRSLYASRLVDRRLHVKMLSKRVSVNVEEGTTEIAVERSWVGEPHESLSWRQAGTNEWTKAARGEVIAVRAATTIELASGQAGIARRDVPAGSHRLGAVARRALTEARDRALPSFRRFARRG